MAFKKLSPDEIEEILLGMAKRLDMIQERMEDLKRRVLGSTSWEELR